MLNAREKKILLEKIGSVTVIIESAQFAFTSGRKRQTFPALHDVSGTHSLTYRMSVPV
jgi:hypothetical protein